MKSERGQSLVELGISLVVMLFLFGGLVEFGIIFFQYVQLKDAAQEGALYGSLYPYDTVSIEQRVRNSSTSPIDLHTPNVEIFISYPEVYTTNVHEYANLCCGSSWQGLPPGYASAGSPVEGKYRIA